jgi:alpha-glucosidase
MRKVLEEYEGRVLIGEIYLPLERLVAYYGADLSGAHLPFNFQLIHMVWSAREIAALVDEYEGALPEGGWPNWVLGNHDQPRIAARVGKSQARIAAMLLLTLRGTPTVYYGDEIGLANVEIPADAVQDPWEKNEPGLSLGRDPERTPMQWDGSLNGGFTTGRPWLPLDADFVSHNVDVLSQDPTSILRLYRQLIAFRRDHLALSVGQYVPMRTENEIFAFERRYGSDRLLVALNFGQKVQEVILPADAGQARVLVSTCLDGHHDVIGSHLALRPDEGVLVRLDAI